MMEVQLFGAAKIVTGSCYSIVFKNERILIDCGLFQGNKEITKLNYEDFGFNPKEYDSLLLTHAHLDHCGRIPKLVKQGFKGAIYCTSATKDLAYVVMMDSAKLAMHDTEHENKRRVQQGLPSREPMYGEYDVKETMKLFRVVEYGKWIKIGEMINAKFHDAGHILGSSSIQLEIDDDGKKKIIVFSGDIGQSDNPIVKDPEIVTKTDYLFIESTYGDRLHSPVKQRKQKLLEAIHDTYKRGGKLMIPSFAIERAQELLYDINEFVEHGLMPKMKVFIDSPMAIKTTEVFKNHPECYDKEIKAVLDSGDNPFSFPGLTYSQSVQQSKAIDNEKNPCIIIAGSGMCTGGRIKYHIKNNIGDEKNTILFVGYQVKGTLGYWIKKGEKKIRLLGTEVEVKARVDDIDSFSAHADYEGLLSWLKHYSPKPKKVFIVHGDEESADFFSQKVKKIGIKAYIPNMREKIIL
jgi:metallo-beta-lactamase family protein